MAAIGDPLHGGQVEIQLSPSPVPLTEQEMSEPVSSTTGSAGQSSAASTASLPSSSGETPRDNSKEDADESPRNASKFFPTVLHASVQPPPGLVNLSPQPTKDNRMPSMDVSIAPTAAWSVDGDNIFSIDAEDFQNEAVHMGGELSISDIDEKYNERLARARVISYIGFCISFVQGTIAIVFGISHEVISLTAMGAQISIDLLSSVMVIWRFYTRSGGTRRNPRHADANTRFREALREKRAALGVGLLLTATGIWAASWAFVKVFGTPPAQDVRVDRARVTLAVAWPAFVICSVMSFFKWSYAFKLRSRVLQKDAVCGTFGAALSFITALFATIDYSVSGAQTNSYATGAADSVAALIMSALLMVEGFRTIYQNSLGWIPPNGVTKETIDQYYQSRRVSVSK